MSYPSCEKTNCVNYKKEHCTLKNPEKGEASCLHYEDIMDSLRLKADVFRGALKRE
ncbi:MAG: hypothetical protein OEY39_01800 [Candidatus Bathyarchaeota archaeon]|nr:hypothetical protein [Candidatus Bathyarchaeota archaeon]